MWQVRRGYRGRGLVRLIEPRSEKGRERERENPGKEQRPGRLDSCCHVSIFLCLYVCVVVQVDLLAHVKGFIHVVVLSGVHGHSEMGRNLLALGVILNHHAKNSACRDKALHCLAARAQLSVWRGHQFIQRRRRLPLHPPRKVTERMA